MDKESTYDIYVRFFGMVKSGTKVEYKDYGSNTFNGFVQFNEEERTAATLGVNDVKDKYSLKSKAELEEEIKRLLGK